MRGYRALAIGLFVVVALVGLSALAMAEEVTVSGLYVSDTNAKAAIKLKHVPSKEGVAAPRKGYRAVLFYRDAASPADKCMFEFWTTKEKAPNVNVMDIDNKDCKVRLEVIEGKLNVTQVSEGCIAKYCTGAGTLPLGTYVKQAKPAEKPAKKMPRKKKAS